MTTSTKKPERMTDERFEQLAAGTPWYFGEKQSVDGLVAEARRARAAEAELRAELETLRGAYGSLMSAKRGAVSGLNETREELLALRAAHAQAVKERDEAQRAREQAREIAERAWVSPTLTAERDAAVEELGRLRRELEAARAAHAHCAERAKEMERAIGDVLGQQHVLKAAIAFIRRWGADPKVIPADELARVERHIEEWHRRLVAARAFSTSPAPDEATKETP